MEWLLPVAAAVVAGGCVAWFAQRRDTQRRLVVAITAARAELRARVERDFLVQPCPRCHESALVLLAVSPNGRSVSYQCAHCKKKAHAAASSPKSVQATEAWGRFNALVDRYNAAAGESQHIIVEVGFVAPAAPLPYERTSRTPIPEAVRGEVWRRDGGRCVQCGANANLQFDHVIPVARGGATTAANLQLLCQPCNGAKGKRI